MDFFQIIGIIASIYIGIGILVGCIEYYLSSPKDLPLAMSILLCMFVWPVALYEHYNLTNKK